MKIKLYSNDLSIQKTDNSSPEIVYAYCMLPSLFAVTLSVCVSGNEPGNLVAGGGWPGQADGGTLGATGRCGGALSLLSTHSQQELGVTPRLFMEANHLSSSSATATATHVLRTMRCSSKIRLK